MLNVLVFFSCAVPSRGIANLNSLGIRYFLSCKVSGCLWQHRLCLQKKLPRDM